MKKSILTVLLLIYAGIVSANWTYDSSAKTLTEAGNANPWIFKVSVQNATNLTVTGISQSGGSSFVDLSAPITPSGEEEYRIVAIGNNAFKGNTFITEVSMPDTLLTIGSSAFASCSALKKVTLSDSLLTINDSAFSSCAALEKVEPFLPASLTTIGSHIFNTCTKLTGDLVLGGEEAFTFAYNRYGNQAFTSTAITSVKMGEGVTYIPARAFSYCTALTNVVLSSKLTTIDQQGTGGYSGTFLGCIALRTVTPFLPETLTFLGHATFNGCTNLVGDLVLGSDAPFTMNRYNYTGHHFYKTRITSVKMGDGVTALMPCSFANCQYLTNVVLSSKLERIEMQGAGGESGAFQNCIRLRKVTPFLPASLTQLGHITFSGCTNLIGDLVLGGSETTFKFLDYGNTAHNFQNTRITSITLKENVTSVPKPAFVNCAYVTSIVVEAENPVFGDNVFQNDIAVRDITFKSFPTWTANTFRGWTNYQARFWIPKIDAEWTAYYSDTTKVTPWSSLTSTDAETAYYTKFGSDAETPYGYTVSGPAKQWILPYLPDGNEHIMQIASTVGEYGDISPAYGEYTLTGETEPIACSAPEYLSIDKDLHKCTGFIIYQYDVETGEWNEVETGEEHSTSYATSGVSGIRRLVWQYEHVGYKVEHSIPEWVTIASSKEYLGLENFYAAGSEITLTASSPNGIFRRWYGDIPEEEAYSQTITTTVDKALVLIPYFEVGWTYDSSAKTITDGYYALKTTLSGTSLTVTGVATQPLLPLLDLKKSVNDGTYIVTAFGPAAFNSNKILEEVMLPDTLVSFNQRGDGPESGTFVNCIRLRKVTPFLPDSVTTITHNVFRGCTNLTGDLVLGGSDNPVDMRLYHYHGHHFYKTRITSVKMGEGVTVLRTCAFANCHDLTNVVLSSKLERIEMQGSGGDSGAFLNCSRLRTVTPFLPETLTFLGFQTFQNCTNLTGDLVLGSDAPFTMNRYNYYGNHFYKTRITSVKMGEGVTTLMPCSFAYCYDLTNVVLSSKLERIEMQGAGGASGAFLDCIRLRTVTPFLPETLTYLGFQTFQNCTNLTGDLVLGGPSDTLNFALYGSTANHFYATRITSVSFMTNVVSIPNNTLNNTKQVKDIYFYGKPTSIGNSALSNWDNYQARIHIPRYNDAWAELIMDTTKVTPWAELDEESVQPLYWENFTGLKPHGLCTVAPFKNQWVMRWNPMGSKATVILIK